MQGRKNQKAKVLGLTGNIACGKSTVCQMLRRLGAQIVDADLVAHEEMRAGPVPAAIARRFGPEVLGPDGAVDRTRLGPLVFGDPHALRDLEAIVHPAVIRRVDEFIRETTAPAIVIDAIKLIEAGIHRRCDQIWVVTCTPQQQVRRLIATRGLTRNEAWLRIRAQPPPEQKLPYADAVIDNSGTLDETWQQVREAYQRLLADGI